jgi:sugar-specific transcriptional regulator TrmB
LKKTQKGERSISVDEEDIQTLIKLGLNGAQAKIYLTLTTLGAANVKQIAQTAKIDRGETYRQLEQLQQKNIVEKILNTPNEYKPMPLNNTLKLLIKQKNQESIQTQKKAKAMLKKAAHYSDTNKELENKISIIPKNEYLKQYITGIYERAQKEIIWYTQIERIPATITLYYQANKKALDRGIQLRTIAELNKPTDQALKFIQRFKNENPNFHIKYVKPTLLTTFAICDGKELDIFTQAAKSTTDSPALYTNNPQITKPLKEFFELKWNTATKKPPTKRQIDSLSNTYRVDDRHSTSPPP